MHFVISVLPVGVKCGASPLGPVALDEPHDADAGAEALLGVRALAQIGPDKTIETISARPTSARRSDHRYLGSPVIPIGDV